MFELEFEVLNLQFSCVHVMLQKATGAVAKTSELSSSGMEIEIAELLYGLMLCCRFS
jgi:hypothetical protein